MIRTLAHATALLFAVAAPALSDGQLWRMGTASLGGVYYPVGVALCRLVNADRRDHGIRCAALPSEGSLGNIAALREGTLELAIVQSDVQAAALTGTGALDGQPPMDDLRALFALHPEPLTIVARPGAGIAELDDLPGTRLDYGPPGAGQRELWETVMDRLGWTEASFEASPGIAPNDVARALCEERIDAFVVALGHPALIVQEATTSCDARLVAVAGAAIDALVAENPYYFDAEIPGGLYAGNAAPTPTFGVGATLVARADLAEEAVHTLVAGVFDAFDELRGLHPVLTALDAETMATEGLAAPLHPGAARYFRERGWID